MDDTIFAHLVMLQAHRPRPDINLWKLFFDAGPIVKAVIIMLVVMSVVCWFIIGAKAVRLSRATGQSGRFLDLFWKSEWGNTWTAERLEGVYTHLKRVDGSPLARVFHAGYVELARVTGSAERTQPAQGPYAQAPQQFGGDLENVERALKRAQINEITSLETAVPFLATTGSTAPFVGLFGTVWGIMNSFIAIAGEKNAGLDVVAPGIAEALFATAFGLLAAIPAVMAYNYFVRRIRVLESEMDAFASDYLNIVRRHFLKG